MTSVSMISLWRAGWLVRSPSSIGSMFELTDMRSKVGSMVRMFLINDMVFIDTLDYVSCRQLKMAIYNGNLGRISLSCSGGKI